MGAMTFGERLRAMREAKGWSRRHLGYLIDRSESTIKNWETDEDEPNDDLQAQGFRIDLQVT